MENYGGVLPFELLNGTSNKGEYWKGHNRVDVDCGRSAIQYILEYTRKDILWLPVYNCPLVSQKIKELFPDISINFYNLMGDFRPILPRNLSDCVVLYVNYFGLMKDEVLDGVLEMFDSSVDVVIDNIPGYFEQPRQGGYNVYSCRKFIGVPDGAHIINDVISGELPRYETCHNYDYLLQVAETGSNGAYENYQISEERFQKNRIPYGMPDLTKKILSLVDYDYIKKRRHENFAKLHDILGNTNQINMESLDAKKIPLVYPLIIRDGAEIRKKLVENGVFVSTFWKHVITNEFANAFEKELAQNLIPIPLDQRYSNEDIEELAYRVLSFLT